MAKRKFHRKTTRRADSVRVKARRSPNRPRTLRHFRAMNDEQQERWTQALNTIAKMRAEKMSLNKAARALGTDAKTVKQLAGSALRKDRRGRLVPTKRDSFLRVLNIPGRKGAREVVVRDSRTASQLASYAAAVRRFIRRGDPSRLKGFRKLVIKDANGKRIGLVTNLRQLSEQGRAGVLSFESLYGRTS